MNWNQLQYVITITEEKSITKAARKLFISQPSLSLSIQSLEKEIGTALFERKNGETTPTYAGSLFYEWAVSTLHSQQQLTAKMNDIAKDRRHLIRFGISPHRSILLLPEIVKQFYQDFPDCELRIEESPTYQLKKMLDNNELDFMVDIPNPDTLNYRNDLLAVEKILLAVPCTYLEKHPEIVPVDSPAKEGSTIHRTLSGAKTITLTDLSSCPFILLSPDHVIGKISRKICESTSFYPDIRLTCRNLDMAVSLVSSQLGATFVPEIYAGRHIYDPQVRYFFIKDYTETRQICLVYRKNLYQTAPLRSLLQLFHDMFPKLYVHEKGAVETSL
ncbi:MAG: LysR family transcriptional regulator [Lachnospiraceae bacterium]|nr:LysR family transcriptional regulator [Lachnospiraceae bacterium]